MKTRRTLVFAVLIVGALAACWWYFLRKSPNEPLVMYGNVEVRQVNLGFKMAGRIEKLNVDEGDAVRPGEVLASLEKVYFYDALAQALAQRDQMAANYAKLRAGNRPEEIAQAKALVAEREATLTNARITLNRAQKLLRTPAGSQKTYDDAAAAERQADAQLNSAREALRLEEAGFRKEDIDLAKAHLDEREAMVNSAKLSLADADLIAPSAGIILSRVREVGAIAAAGETVYVLSLTNPVWVRTYVSEPDLGRIRPGMEVQVKTDTPGARTYTGRIAFISTAAEFTPKTLETTELRTSLVYRLRIVVDGGTDFFRQGMPVTVVAAPPVADSKTIAAKKRAAPSWPRQLRLFYFPALNHSNALSYVQLRPRRDTSASGIDPFDELLERARARTPEHRLVSSEDVGNLPLSSSATAPLRSRGTSSTSTRAITSSAEAFKVEKRHAAHREQDIG